MVETHGNDVSARPYTRQSRTPTIRSASMSAAVDTTASTTAAGTIGRSESGTDRTARSGGGM